MTIGKKERAALEEAVRTGMLKALYEAKIISAAQLAQALYRMHI